VVLAAHATPQYYVFLRCALQVCTSGFQEIVYGTFSGRVGSFTTESLRLRDEEDPYGRAKETVMKESQITRLRKEMETLKVRACCVCCVCCLFCALCLVGL
jgi:hypothetical protein